MYKKIFKYLLKNEKYFISPVFNDKEMSWKPNLFVTIALGIRLKIVGPLCYIIRISKYIHRWIVKYYMYR